MIRLGQLLVYLGRADVTEIVVGSGRPITIKSGGAYKPLTAATISTGQILELLRDSDLESMMPEQDTGGVARSVTLGGTTYRVQLARRGDSLSLSIERPPRTDSGGGAAAPDSGPARTGRIARQDGAGQPPEGARQRPGRTGRIGHRDYGASESRGDPEAERPDTGQGARAAMGSPEPRPAGRPSAGPAAGEPSPAPGAAGQAHARQIVEPVVTFTKSQAMAPIRDAGPVAGPSAAEREWLELTPEPVFTLDELEPIHVEQEPAELGYPEPARTVRPAPSYPPAAAYPQPAQTYPGLPEVSGYPQPAAAAGSASGYPVPPSAPAGPQSAAGYPVPPSAARYPAPPSAGYPTPQAAAGYPQPQAAGYPAPQSAAGYPAPPSAAGYPMPPSAAGYPQPMPAAGYPAPPSAAGYPMPAAGYPAPQSVAGYPMPQPAAGYPAPQSAGYPAPPSAASYPAPQPAAGYPMPQPAAAPPQPAAGYPLPHPAAAPPQPAAYPAPSAVAQPAPQPAAHHAPPAPPPRPRLAEAVDRAVPELLAALVVEARARGATDLHVSPGQPALMRCVGQLVPGERALDAATVNGLLEPLLGASERVALAERGYVDLALDVPGRGGGSRLRTNISRQRGGLKGAFRLIWQGVPTLETLGLPADLARVTHYHQGLVVIAGPSGHGKTTTLAAVVDLINASRPHHILSIEDPIEVVHPRKLAVVSQRAVGLHTLSFATALKASLREDPDVIVIGEVRDRETVEIALTAAETGHLVIATMSTPSAAKTIDRVIDMFPPADQTQVRVSLAAALRFIVTQRLLPARTGDRMVPAVELLTGVLPVAALIRDNKLFQLPSVQQRGRAFGMIRFDDSLLELVRAGQIDEQVALAAAENPRELLAALQPAAPGAAAAAKTSGRMGGLFKRGRE